MAEVGKAVDPGMASRLVDVAVANDTVPNFLFHNLGNGRFEEIGVISGIAIDRIRDDARFVEDLGLDSLSIIESLVAVEQEFRLQAEAEDVEAQVHSVEDAVQLVEGQLRRKAG